MYIDGRTLNAMEIREFSKLKTKSLTNDFLKEITTNVLVVS